MYTQLEYDPYRADTQNPPSSHSSQYDQVLNGKPNEMGQENLLLKVIARYQRRISRIRMISRIVSATMSLAMCGIMSFVIAVFLTTRNDQALDRPIWAKEPKTWPAVLLLTASLLTMVASIATVCYYCLYFKRANDSWKVVVLTYSIHIALWLVVTFLYRYEKDVSDLWGWSCTPIAAELQAKGNIRVDFTTLCHVQVRLQHGFVPNKKDSNGYLGNIMGAFHR